MLSNIRKRDSYWRGLERAGRRIASVVVRISVSEIVDDKKHQQPWANPLLETKNGQKFDFKQVHKQFYLFI